MSGQDIDNAVGVENGVTNSARATGIMPDGTLITSPESTPGDGSSIGISLPGSAITKTAG